MRHTYLFVGLTPSERALLESLFALDDGQGDEMAPARRPDEAHLVVANGDDPAVVERLRAEHPQALIVLVGHPAGQPAPDLPVLQRPLEPGAVAGVFSGLDWPDHLQGGAPNLFGFTFASSSITSASQPASVPAAAPSGAPGDVDFSAFAPTTLTAPLTAPTLDRVSGVSVPPMDAMPKPPQSPPAPPVEPARPDQLAESATVTPATVSARASWAHSEIAAPAELAPAQEADLQPPDVLVVVGALGERSPTLPHGIRRLGLRVQLVQAGEALALFSQQPVDFVFLDQASLGDALLPLARALAARRAGAGQPPHVVVVARRGSAFDRLRARLIGCTWMLVPIDRARLAAFFMHRGRQLRG